MPVLIVKCVCVPFCRRYRGYIERVSPIEPRFEVYFIDFGNKERLNSEDVRPLDAALSAVPAQARPAQLAYVKVGGESSSAGDNRAAVPGFR
jgi:staphylococcal nuclease domain-containing protein 1